MIKTFKNYLTELSHPVQTDSEPVAQDWDVKDPGTDDAFEHLNAYVGAVGDREWVSPKIVIKNLHDKRVIIFTSTSYLYPFHYHFSITFLALGAYSLEPPRIRCRHLILAI